LAIVPTQDDEMKKHLLVTVLAGMVGLSTACAVSSPEHDEHANAVKTGSTSEAVVSAEQICCNDINGWGSVVYYQSWAGYSWVTTDTFYHSGTACPSTSGTCARVEPIK
jgi:hypothetical protein